MAEMLINMFETAGIPCIFHWVTGLYCPGCGGTRAAKALLKGEIWTSIHYNPVVAYGAFVLALLAVSWIISRILHSPRLFIRRYGIFLAGGFLLGAVNCIYKNYYLIVKGIDLLQI